MLALFIALALAAPADASSVAAPWRVEPSDEHPGKVFVLRADGSRVTVWDGHRDTGQLDVLGRRLRALDDGLRPAGRWVARVGLSALAAGLVLSGIAVFTAGLVMFGITLTPLNQDVTTSRYEFLFAQSPGVMLGGAVGAATGLLAAAGLWGLVLYNQTRSPPPPDPRLLRQLGNATLWDEDDARRVVHAHNTTTRSVAGPP